MRSVYDSRDEQHLVREFFGDSPGIFVDVGANDPVVNSQSYHLEMMGWTGILVEPVPEYADRLRKQRKAPVFQVACGRTSAEGTKVKMFVSGPYSSMRQELMLPEAVVDHVVEVDVRCLDSLLAEASIGRIDLLSLDVEGYELEVLHGFSMTRWQPRLVLIEDLVLDLTKHRYMTSQKYKLVRRTGVNAWYVPAQSAFALDWEGHWQLFRKYVIGLPFRRFRFTIRKWRGQRPN